MCLGIERNAQHGNVAIALDEKPLILKAGNDSTTNGMSNATEKIESSCVPNGVLPNKHSLSSVTSLKASRRAPTAGETTYTTLWNSTTLRLNSAPRLQRVERGMNSIVN